MSVHAKPLDDVLMYRKLLCSQWMNLYIEQKYQGCTFWCMWAWVTCAMTLHHGMHATLINLQMFDEFIRWEYFQMRSSQMIVYYSLSWLSDMVYCNFSIKIILYVCFTKFLINRKGDLNEKYSKTSLFYNISAPLWPPPLCLFGTLDVDILPTVVFFKFMSYFILSRFFL